MTLVHLSLKIKLALDLMLIIWSIGLGEIGLVDLKFKIKTAPLGFGQEI